MTHNSFLLFMSENKAMFLICTMKWVAPSPRTIEMSTPHVFVELSENKSTIMFVLAVSSAVM